MKYLILIMSLGGMLQPTAPIEENEINKIIIEAQPDTCYDELMGTWFINFHKNQEAGADMKDADKKAADRALEMYHKCAD